MTKYEDAEKRRSLGVQIVVGLLGLVLSIVLHEAFHVYMHWGHITHVDFFPRPDTIIQIDADIPPGYDLQAEETVAYGITLLVTLITVALIFKVRDADDTRSASKILFPKDRDMQKMGPEEMLDLTGVDDEKKDTDHKHKHPLKK